MRPKRPAAASYMPNANSHTPHTDTAAVQDASAGYNAQAWRRLPPVYPHRLLVLYLFQADDKPDNSFLSCAF
jgi:hypothetical protein